MIGEGFTNPTPLLQVEMHAWEEETNGLSSNNPSLKVGDAFSRPYGILIIIITAHTPWWGLQDPPSLPKFSRAARPKSQKI